MSIKATSWVWENSKQKGSKLLMLLAIADRCDDEGVCFPGLSSLATKARQSANSARETLRNLELSGELVVVANAGIDRGYGRTNRYYLKSYRESLGLSTPASTQHLEKILMVRQARKERAKTRAVKVKGTPPLNLGGNTSVKDIESSKEELSTPHGVALEILDPEPAKPVSSGGNGSHIAALTAPEPADGLFRCKIHKAAPFKLIDGKRKCLTCLTLENERKEAAARKQTNGDWDDEAGIRAALREYGIRGGLLNRMYHICCGTSKEKDYLPDNIIPPVEADEFPKFTRWWRYKFPSTSMPTSPHKFSSHFQQARAEKFQTDIDRIFAI